MVRRVTARPADKPGRAVVISGDRSVQDDAGVAEKKKASEEKRQRTIRSTMVFTGMGIRRSETAAAKTKAKSTKPATTKKVETKAKVTAPAAEVVTPASEDVVSVPDAQPGVVVASSDDPSPEPAVTSPPRRNGKSRQQLVARISGVIWKELDLIDAALREAPGDASLLPDTERHARTIAALTRVLAELRKEPAAASTEQRRSDDGDRPRDIAELRERLARRLEQYRAGRI